MRRYLVASVACGVVIAGATIASAVVLAGIVAGVITEPASRSLTHWAGPLTILLGLWTVRTVAHWLQGRLSVAGATAVIAELAGRVLRTVTALPPRLLAAERDSAAALITRGLDGLRPFLTAYLPAVFLAGILTPAAVVVIALVDWRSALIVLIALPLIPVFMVLIGLMTRERSEASLAAMTTLQSRRCGHWGASTARRTASPNSQQRIDVRPWPPCGSRSCPHWCSNCWLRWGWRWSRSASACAWCSER
jgi:ATP-binding cassette subfamily C protein CydD